jgi:peptide/nickel transport system substrate-binding protein
MKRLYVVVCVVFPLLLVGLFAACQAQAPALLPTLVPTIRPPTSAPTATPTPTPTPLPASTPTPVPPKELTVCQASEPNTLFIYGGPSRAALNVLEAIYDGPIDSQGYEFQPVILEKLPSLADGDVSLRTVRVKEGDTVMDADGLPVELLPDVTVRSADGRDVTFEGGVVTMTQVVVTFTLRPDITWADGQPLTAHDSRYSFELAREFDHPALQALVERTLSYNAMDERTVVWTGIPGYRNLLYPQSFYLPLPRHVWAGSDAEQLLSAEVARQKPLGWGPFVVEEWVEGEHIKLIRNAKYFRASEGLPYLDRVIFRFVPDLGQAVNLLEAGGCDLIAQDLIEGSDLTPLLAAVDRGEARFVSSSSSEWEHLDFGIGRAGWFTHPDFFGDVRVRQAVAMCVDREQVAQEAFKLEGADVVHSYVPPDHPLYADARLYRWDHDPLAGISLLEEVGWTDQDGDGIREAHGVSGIVNYTPFSVTLLTTADYPPRERMAHVLADNLAACGIDLAVEYLPAGDFFADGPDGLVFGRQFELALFSWMNGLDAPCGLYLSTEIPGPENWWAASNNPGYASEDYDAACLTALDALPGTETFTRFHHEAQRIFSHDLPVLPLTSVPKLVAVRPEVSGVVLDPGEYLELWNIEAFDVDR